MLVDPFKRKISYIRISVTDRCDFRCTYCMSEEMQFLPKKDLLSLEELERLSSVFIELGVKKIRITGCLLYTSPSPRDLSTSRMPSSA